MRNLSSFLIMGFYYLFGLIFLWLFLSIILDNQIYSFKTSHIVLYLTIWLLLTGYIYKMGSRAENFILKHEKKIAIPWMLVIFSLQLYCGYLLAVTTSWDTEAVFRGAINLSQQGNLGNYRDYFHIFPHNLGATSILQLLFTIFSAKNTDDFYLIATIYNVSSNTLGIVFVYLICREIKGVKIAFLSLWLSSCCIPLYFYTSIFYSDTLSLPFVTLSYYLYLKILASESKNQQILFACLFAMACVAGTLIKFTVAIVAIAALIDVILRGHVKKYWLAVIVVATLFFALLSGFNHYRSTFLLDKNLSEQKQVPYTHWVMMGLSGNGAYNGSDYGYTHSFSTLEARTQANLDRINQRLNDYGFSGYLDFLHRKQQVNFGSGIYGVNEMIDDGPLRPNLLHEFALDSGKHYETVRHFAQGYHVFIFLMIAFGAIYDATTKKQSSINVLVIRLSITGLFIFLALWESNSRYIYNFIPIFIAGAALSFPEFYRVMSIVKNSLYDHILDARSASLTQDSKS